MCNLKSLKKIIAVMLVFIMTAGCIVISDAEGRSIEDTDAGTYTKTFECNTKGGTLYIKDSKGKVLKELEKGDRITYKYPSAKSPDELYVEAVADEEYVVDAYLATWLLSGDKQDTCESVYGINEKTYKRSHYLNTAEYDEVFSVSFVKEGTASEDGLESKEEEITTVRATASPDIDNPKTGDVFTGKAKLTYNGKRTDSYNGTGYITCTSGEFKGDQITLKNCASGSDHWAPQTGQTGTYKITITKVDKKSGEVTCKVEWQNDSYTAGYQNLSGTFTYSHSFDGEFKLYKMMGEAEGSFVLTSSFRDSMDLSATFTLYSDEACTKKMGEIETGVLGNCMTEVVLDPGTYYVKETKAPKGFAINPTVFKVKVGASSCKSLEVKDNVLRAKISGVKIDSWTGKSVPTPGLSLAGATYVIYEDRQCRYSLATGVSDADGNIEFDTEYFCPGTYYIKETKAPKGYNLDTEVHEVVVDESNGYYEGSTERLKDVSFISTETPQPGKGKVIKKSLEENITKGNSCYSLAGCKFQLTSVSTGEVIPEVLVTDENGVTQEVTLAVGEYVVREIEAPKGFKLSEEEQILTVEKDKTAKVEFYDEPTNDPARVLLKKIDEETGMEVVTGAGEFAGAEYTFKYYDGQYTTEQQLAGVVPTRTWVLATDEKGIIYLNTAKKISGDEFYVDGNGVRTLPLGTLTIQETKAPEGYNKDDTLYIQNITADFKGAIVKSYQTPTSAEPVIRGDLKGVKVSSGDMKRLVNVPFKITSVASGESHVVVTDKNGEFNTSSSFNPHSQNTNQGKTSKDGVWFGDISKLDDEKGALPYGSYIIEELPCEVNKDKILIEPFEVAVLKNDTVVDLGTLVNEYIPVPEISTMATDKNTGLQVAYADKETTIVDSVEIAGLMKGRQYALKGFPVDKTTGKPIVVNGKEATVERTFKPDNTYAVIDLEFTFDSSKLIGKDLVWYEYLYHDGAQVAKHTDIKDRKQTIRIAEPEIGTSATDKNTGKRTAYIDKESTIVDEVTYRGVIAGEEHTLKGVVMDKATGKPLLVNGKEITAEKEFIANNAKGAINLEFTFDSSELKGKEVVVFEYLYHDGKQIAEHTNIKDEKQTIKYESPEEPTTEQSTTEEIKKSKKTPKTGDSVKVGVFVLLTVVFLACGVYLFYKSRKPDKKE